MRTNMPATRGGRVLASAAMAVSLGIIAAAQRDLHRRPASGIRGDKRVWRLACLNALGALAYLRWGRRPP